MYKVSKLIAGLFNQKSPRLHPLNLKKFRSFLIVTNPLFIFNVVKFQNVIHFEELYLDEPYIYQDGMFNILFARE